MGRPPGSRNKSAETGTELATVEHVPQDKMMLLEFMADKYSLNPDEFSRTVRAVCGMPTATPEQFAAFLLVAKTYNLNPLVKEIYGFPSRTGGIVPIVSVDGWVNLVNSQGQCDGFSFEMEQEGQRLISCTCSMYRKDRTHAVVVTEYYEECVRSTDAWKMKHRMLRHKSFIQAARYAFGFSGIYDEDEGQKIAEIDPSKDAGPPRVAAADPKLIEGTTNPPAAEPSHDSEEARDGTPPRRAPKADAKADPKPDPISSGPARAQTEKPGPSAKAVEPFKIPGTNETFESWAEKYVDNIKTSPDTATAYKWIDVNADPLTRLQKGKPSIYATVKKATEQTMQALKDAAAKATDKAAKKAAPKPAAASPSDMDDARADEMDARAADMEPEFPTPAPPADDNPETILKWIEATLAAVDQPEDLENIWTQHCEPKILDLIPPDKDEAQGIYRKHEKRLEP